MARAASRTSFRTLAPARRFASTLKKIATAPQDEPNSEHEDAQGVHASAHQVAPATRAPNLLLHRARHELQPERQDHRHDACGPESDLLVLCGNEQACNAERAATARRHNRLASATIAPCGHEWSGLPPSWARMGGQLYWGPSGGGSGKWCRSQERRSPETWPESANHNLNLDENAIGACRRRGPELGSNCCRRHLLLVKNRALRVRSLLLSFSVIMFPFVPLLVYPCFSLSTHRYIDIDMNLYIHIELYLFYFS